jgi:DNA-binding transcriptional ArsR family regulator
MGSQETRQLSGSGSGSQSKSLIRALNHPLRIKMLSILGQRSASPREMSRELGEELSNVSYHARALKKDGLAEIVHEEPVRGAVQHFYRATDRPVLGADDWEELDPEVRRSALEYGLGRIYTDATVALHAGTVDRRRGGHLSRTPLVVDEEGWQVVSSILDTALQDVLEESTKSAARLAESGEDRIPMLTALIGFERPPQSQ